MADLKSRKREKAIANEIANELHRALGPIMPEALAKNSDVVCKVFGEAFDRNRIVDESAGARILSYVPKILAGMNFKFVETNRQLDVAVRQPMAS